MPSIFKKVENLIKKSPRHKISLEALQVVTYKLTNDSIAYRFDETFNVLPLPHIYKVHFCDSYHIYMGMSPFCVLNCRRLQLINFVSTRQVKVLIGNFLYLEEPIDALPLRVKKCLHYFPISTSSKSHFLMFIIVTQCATINKMIDYRAIATLFPAHCG